MCEGAASGGSQRITDSFIPAFAIALKASVAEMALLRALPNFAGAMAQLFTPALVGAARSRKRLLLACMLLGALVWGPIAFLPWLSDGERVTWLLALVTVAVVLFQLPAPAWGSWIPQLVPARRLGTYMAGRGMLALVLSATLALAVARWLDFMNDRVFIGFMAVFLTAMAFRLASFALFLGVYEPPRPGKPDKGAGVASFFRGLAVTNLARFMLYTACVNLAVSVAGPFFTVVMLQDLKFSYTTIILIEIAATSAHVVGLRFWGPLSDRKGNLLVVRVTAPIVAVFPLLWTINQSPWYLMTVEALAGLAWSGWNLCVLNYVYEASSPEERARNVSRFNALNGTGVLAGALLGAALAPVVPALFAYSLMTLFLVSGALRFLAAAALLPLVKEVRHTRGVLASRQPLFIRMDAARAHHWTTPQTMAHVHSPATDKTAKSP